MLKCLQSYCMNAPLTGLAYIANNNLHLTERIFWLLCMLASAVGSYLLIRDFQVNFERSAVSVVYEQLPDIMPPVDFAAVGVCELNVHKFRKVAEYVNGLNDTRVHADSITDLLSTLAFPKEQIRDVHDQANRVLENLADSEEAQNLLGNYRQLSAKFQANCSEMFEKCIYMGARIDCCAHFRPLMTTTGHCFLANSLLTPNAAERDDRAHWLPYKGDAEAIPTADDLNVVMVDEYILRIHLRQPAEVQLLTANELPFNSLETLSVAMVQMYSHKLIRFDMQQLINDASVREISPAGRKCRFDDELLPQTRYAAYSFTTCLSDCVRAWQMRLCNCTLYNYLPYAAAGIRECNLSGYICVDEHGLLTPPPIDLAPWKLETPCNCLPSCTDAILQPIADDHVRYGPEGQDGKNFVAALNSPYVVTLVMQRPQYRYRRQSLRTRLDVVVTIGGILGLFMGASILSGIELCYFLTLRFYYNYRCGDNNNN